MLLGTVLPLRVSGFVRFEGGQPGRGFRCTRTLSGSRFLGWQKYNNNNNINYFLYTPDKRGQHGRSVRIPDTSEGLSGFVHCGEWGKKSFLFKDF
jgi:hypothetical protein